MILIIIAAVCWIIMEEFMRMLMLEKNPFLFMILFFFIIRYTNICTKALTINANISRQKN